MISDIRDYSSHYIALGFILMGGMILLAMFRLQPQIQELVVIAMAGLYALWGILHHKSVGDLDWKIAAEYILMGLLAVLLVNGVLLNQ